MSMFTDAELAYLAAQQLGRLATVNQRGEPQIAPVTFRYNPATDTIDIGGFRTATTQKYRNIVRNGLAAFVVDDVLPPWQVRGIEVRGVAEALPEGGQLLMQGFAPELIRLRPRRIIFWDQSSGQPPSSRDIG